MNPKRIERLWAACPELQPDELHWDGCWFVGKDSQYGESVACALIRDKIVCWLASRTDAPYKLFPPRNWDEGLSGGSQDAFGDATKCDDPTEACVRAAEKVLGLPE